MESLKDLLNWSDLPHSCAYPNHIPMNPSFSLKQPYQKYDPKRKKYCRNSYLCTVEHSDDGLYESVALQI